METISSTFFIPREGDDFSKLYKRVRIMPLYSFPHLKDMNLRLRSNVGKFFVHIDFDAFFAQVEQRDNPKLRGKPVSVGGTGGNGGIVMTASYEARAMGVETGMSVVEAKKLCPGLISLPCYGPKYESIMAALQEMLKRYVPVDCIEQYSIDECFVDLSPVVKNFFEAVSLAHSIKSEIRKLENLTASMGISYNKTFAKLATKLMKPDGMTVITKENEEKIHSMPVSKLWGVGRRNELRMLVNGIRTIGDLSKAPFGLLRKEFGINGIVFGRLARGEDTSGIFRKERKEKSLNHFHTLSEPLYKRDDVHSEIRRIGEYICRKMRHKELVAGYLYLALRFEDLTYTSGALKLSQYTNDDREICKASMEIFKRMRKPSAMLKGRQFGMGVFDLHLDTHTVNLSLFEKTNPMPFQALDRLKAKFGEGVIRVGI
ncbi:MAG: DNA polymerase IV [Ignavibacteria bacterium]|nr:DNA polymerase IV [Ignavibacteria bacterium]